MIRRRKWLSVVQILAGALLLIGVVMQMLGAHASGEVGGGDVKGDFAALEGWQVGLIGIIMFGIAWGGKRHFRNTSGNNRPDC